jgi:5'-phosphate synthase pdxT subunit
MLGVGVLALQGGFELHQRAFARLGVSAGEVRSPADLAGLTHLVLPGGESTTLQHLLTLFELWEPIAARARAGELALFGTCAGAILLGRAPADSLGAPERPPRLALLDALVRRNAYGRQLDSRTLELELAALDVRVPCTFIRAPRIEAVGPDVRVLASAALDARPAAPILVEAPGLLAATFHPELLPDPIVHRRFLNARRTASAAGASSPRSTGLLGPGR